MITIFDIAKLSELLKDFYRITHIRITAFDTQLNELVSYPAAVAPYCRVIRSTARGYSACIDCDEKACTYSAQMKDTYVYRCHAGLTEAVTPLFVGETLVGYLLFGHVFSYANKELGIRTILDCCESLRINERLLIDELQQAVTHSEEYIKSAAQILRAVASYLMLERMASPQYDPAALKLDELLSSRFTEALSVSEICRELKIGKTQLYALSNELYHCGISRHIRDLRITYAKELLTTKPDYRIAAISERCGFSNYNYFITTFTRETGVAPGAYRKAHQNR